MRNYYCKNKPTKSTKYPKFLIHCLIKILKFLKLQLEKVYDVLQKVPRVPSNCHVLNKTPPQKLKVDYNL